MKKVFLIGLLVASSSSLAAELKGRIEVPRVPVPVPSGYFFAPMGTLTGRLSPDSVGTWRVRIMKWMKAREDERQNHFHQVAHSDLSAQGPNQTVSVEEKSGGGGLYRFEIECEDECQGGRDFTVEYGTY